MELKDVYLVDSIVKNKVIPNIYRDVLINGRSHTLKKGELLLTLDKEKMLYSNKNRREIAKLASEPISEEYWNQFIYEYALSRNLPISKVNLRRKHEVWGYAPGSSNSCRIRR